MQLHNKSHPATHNSQLTFLQLDHDFWTFCPEDQPIRITGDHTPGLAHMHPTPSASEHAVQLLKEGNERILIHTHTQFSGVFQTPSQTNLEKSFSNA